MRSIVKGTSIGALLDLAIYTASFLIFGGPHGPAGPMWVTWVLNGGVARLAGRALFERMPGPGDGFLVGGALIALVSGALYGGMAGLAVCAWRAMFARGEATAPQGRSGAA